MYLGTHIRKVLRVFNLFKWQLTVNTNVSLNWNTPVVMKFNNHTGWMESINGSKLQ